MLAKTLSRCLVVASAFVSLNTLAAAHVGAPMMGDMMKMPMMDTNKDGMVSRAEFVDAMGKAFDMHAKEMKAKDGKIDAGMLDRLRNAMFKQ